MATISFEHDIIIKDDKTCKIFSDVINSKKEPRIISETKNINIEKAILKGENLLKKYCSHFHHS